jgi:type IV pilus assembly protein PilA
VRLRKAWPPVVALILTIVVVLFINTPSFTDSHNGPRQNESAAVGSLRKINALERQHALRHATNGFACELSQLRSTDKANDQYDAIDAPLNGEWSGYKFILATCVAETSGIISHYQAVAIPVDPGKTGVRAFCTDESGELFYDPDGSASGCLSTRRPI